MEKSSVLHFITLFEIRIMKLWFHFEGPMLISHHCTAFLAEFFCFCIRKASGPLRSGTIIYSLFEFSNNVIKSRRDDFSFFHFYQREWNCPPCLFDGCDDNWVFLDIVAQSELPVIKECLHLSHYEHCVGLHNRAKTIMKSYFIFFCI